MAKKKRTDNFLTHLLVSSYNSHGGAGWGGVEGGWEGEVDQSICGWWADDKEEDRSLSNPYIGELI